MNNNLIKWLLGLCFIVITSNHFSYGQQIDQFIESTNSSIGLTEEELEWIKDNPVIRATNKLDTAPNEFVRGGQPAGFSVDYLNLVAEKVGLEIDYIHGFTWAELLEKLSSREIDISHNIFKNERRSQFLDFTEPYLNLEPAFFGLVGSDRIRTIDDLEGKTIGVVSGWALNNEYKQKYPQLEIVEFTSSLDALVRLSEGEIDLYIATLFIGESLLRKYFIDGIEVVGKSDFLEITNNEGARLAVRNDWPILFSILEKGMEAISEQEYRALNEKWLIPQTLAEEIGLTLEELSWLSKNPVVKVVVDKAMLPLESVEEDGTINGVVGSYLEILKEKLNVEFRWVENIAFSDGLEMIMAKEADMITALSQSGNRNDFLLFTGNYMEFDSVIFGREGEDIFGNMGGLSGRSIAMPKDWDITGWIKRDYPDIEIIEVANKTEALQLVSAGIADAHVGSILTTSHNLAAEGITNMVVAGVTPYTTEIKMGIRKDLPLLASAMQKALASVTTEQRMDISTEWLGLKTDQTQDYTLLLRILAVTTLIIVGTLIWNYGLRKEVKRRKESEERFRQIAETVDGVFFICAPDLKETRYLSPNFKNWTNVECEMIYEDARAWMEFIHPDDRNLFREAANRAKNSRYMSKVPDYRIIDSNNEIRWISTQAHPVADDNGEIVSVVGFMTDITSRIKAREKLDEISNQFQNAFTHASHGMALVSLDGKFLRVNDALCQILGYSNTELLRLYIKDVTHPEDINIGATLMQDVADGKRQSFQLEKRHKRKDGGLVPVQLNVSIVRDKNGEPDHFVAQIQDLSALKEREEQLRHSQKMDAVGELTGGIAHDFNNILGIIMGHLELLKTNMPENPKAAERLEKALKGVDRGSSLIDKLLSFSRSAPRQARAKLINENINNLVEVINRTFASSITVETSLQSDLWAIEVDDGDFDNALLNLALNARDAMQGEGELRITTENIVLDENYVVQNPDSHPGEYVLISVGDTGTGIEPEILDKILEPFFTTKPVNKGTGLGLSMVHGFVQRSGGHMRVQSEIGEGTVFKLYIPRVHKEVEQKIEQKPINGELPGGNETILVVDDEKNLCDIAKTQLTNLGYKVHTASNATKALEFLSGNDRIDLLFSDIVMPDNLDGYKMASSALEINPSIKILLTSGYSQKLEKEFDEEDEVLSQLAENVLHKPYSQHDLAIAVRKSLDY